MRPYSLFCACTSSLSRRLSLSSHRPRVPFRSTWSSLVDPITRLVYFVHGGKGVIRWTLPDSLRPAKKGSSRPPLCKPSGGPADVHSPEYVAAIRARIRANVQQQREMVKARQAQREAKTRQEWSERRRHLQRQVALLSEQNEFGRVSACNACGPVELARHQQSRPCLFADQEAKRTEEPGAVAAACLTFDADVFSIRHVHLCCAEAMPRG